MQPRPPPQVLPRLALAAFTDQRPDQVPESSSSGERRGWVPRMDFPKFDGSKPTIWVDQCLAYFRLYQVAESLWVTAATINMVDNAALWLQAYKTEHALGNWNQLVTAILEEFNTDEHERVLYALIQIRQTGSVDAYWSSFSELKYQLRVHDPAASEKSLVLQFLHGLRDEIRAGVELHAPTTVAKAAALARKQEGILERATRPAHRGAAPLRHPAPVFRPEGQPQPARQNAGELWRARQLKEFRRANGLCYGCGDKYTPGHVCAPRPPPAAPGAPQIHAMVGEDGGNILSDETLNELLSEDTAPLSDCTISLHAMYGDRAANTIRLRAMSGHQALLMLVDSGSTHSFISTAMAECLGCVTVGISPIQVKVAGGGLLQCDKMVQNFQWLIQTHTFTADLRVVDLGGYDAVLGVDWLAPFGDTVCNWQAQTMRFQYNGETVYLEGIQDTTQCVATEASAEQLSNWYSGNDIWASALVTATQSGESHNVPPEISVVLQQYESVFGEPTELPPHRTYDHSVPLTADAHPFNLRPYRYTPLQKDEIERQVAAMLKAGTIFPSASPFASPVLLVKKKDGSWRFCVDYRRLNSLTVKNKFPLPVIDELLDELAGTLYFSKLDLRAGYHQIRMCPDDEIKTAFKTHHGHFHFRVMPFGLTNAPATFQCLMNSIFAPQIRKFVLVFVDDILVYSRSLKDHVQHLITVFETLARHHLFVKRSKCSFAQQSMEYLGHIISAQGVATDPAKTAAMVQWPRPSTITELRGFLGLTGYYRKFVRNYGLMAKPLTNLLKKKSFLWTDAATDAFEQLKIAMTTTPVLVLPDFTIPFEVETDACDYGIGAVLMQRGHPVAYLSKALGEANKQLSIYEKEFLAVMLAVDKWRSYLQRGPFVIKTDHRSLCHLEDQQLHTDLQRRAMTKLVGLQFTFQYKKGVENTAADALSRTGPLFAICAISDCAPQWVQEVIHSYDLDNEATNLRAELAICPDPVKGLHLANGLIKKEGQVWVGANAGLRTKLIHAMHSSAVGGHSGIHATYQRIKRSFYWPGLKQDVENLVKQCETCQRAKHELLPPAGKLQPLPIPKGPWQDLSMDFIEGLPCSDSFNCILVIVDRFTKYSHFVPLKHPFTAQTVAIKFLDTVVKLHGPPLSIVSDRDKVFTSHFWQDLFKLMNTELNMSTAYHPQSDGQTERVNQSLEMYLRCSVHDRPKKWAAWLPLAEYWYNTSHHSSLGCSPFQALYGYAPNEALVPVTATAPTTDAAQLLADRQQQMLLLRANLEKAQARMKLYADKHRTERQFRVGEQVWLKLQPYVQSSVASRPFPKLAHKFYGPYQIIRRVGQVAYELKLPDGCQVHPVFHVSQLKPFTADYTPEFVSDVPTPPDFSVMMEPAAILERRMIRKGNAAAVQLKIVWTGLPESSATWEDYELMRQRFPTWDAWGQASSSGAGTVTADMTVPSPG